MNTSMSISAVCVILLFTNNLNLFSNIFETCDTRVIDGVFTWKSVGEKLQVRQKLVYFRSSGLLVLNYL